MANAGQQEMRNYLKIELANQDTYLGQRGYSRKHMRSTPMSLFEAIYEAAEDAGIDAIPEPADMKAAAIDYVRENLKTLGRYMSENSKKSVMRRRLTEMENNDIVVGYEIFLAITHTLKAVILVTEGGLPNNNNVVVTNSFYYGPTRPDTKLHISYVSLGYYDAVVRMEGDHTRKGLNSFVDRQRQHHPTEHRIPSHEHDCHCQHDRRCDAKVWKKQEQLAVLAICNRSPVLMARTSGTRGGCPESGSMGILRQELQAQDKYLADCGLKRCHKSATAESLFQAMLICEKYSKNGAAQAEREVDDLRYETINYIRSTLWGQNSLGKYIDEKASKPELRRMLSEMEEDTENTVGYESFLALTNVLDAVILVTHGGSRDNTVVTDAFYHAAERPKRELHISWVSLGYYDAVIPLDVAEPDIDVMADEGIEELFGENRSPSHKCGCNDASCDGRQWVFPWIKAGKREIGAQNADAKDSRFDDCFLWLKGQAYFIEKWRFVARRLRVDESEIKNVDSIHPNLQDKAYEILKLWKEKDSGPSFTKLEKALRSESMNRIAGQMTRDFGD